MAWIIHTVSKQLDAGKKCLTISLDVEKAYDSIHHRFLLHKLEHYGIRGPTLRLLQNFLTDRTHATYCNTRLSSLTTSPVGLPQGAILSPLLFILFTNDLFFGEWNSSLLAYADDTTCLFPLTNFNDNTTDLLNTDLAKIQAWFDMNLLKLNTTKTEALLFTGKTNNIPIPDSVSIGQMTLPEILRPSITILGLRFLPQISWNSYIDQIHKKLCFAKYLLLKLHVMNVPRFLILKVYKTIFLPLLTFAVPIWGFTSKKNFRRIRAIQNSAIRTIFGMRKHEDVRNVYKEWELLPFGTIFFRHVTLLIHQLRSLPTTSGKAFPSLFIPPTRFRNTRQDPYKLAIPICRREYRKRTIFSDGIRHYNELPVELRSTTNYRTAKKLIRLFCKTHITDWYDINLN